MPTPTWQAARNGLPGDATATDKSAQVNQLLTTHAENHVYQGTRIVTSGAFNDANQVIGPTLYSYLVDQPFVLPAPQTTVGRVTLPVTPVGSGADLQVSLYTDSSGIPGTQLIATRIPAKWIIAQAATSGLDNAANLQTSVNNNLLPGPITVTAWQPPATSVSGYASAPAAVSSGNYLLSAGGTDSSTNAYLTTVFTVPYLGAGTLGNPTLQPSLPQAENGMAMAAATDTVAVAGGWTSPSTGTAAVFAAGWDANTGQIAAWSTQTPLPQVVAGAGGAASGQTMYVVGGLNVSTNTALATVYSTSITGGQLGQSWTTGPPLPVALENPIVGVVGNVLLVTGGTTASGSHNATTFYAPLASDGTISQWLTAPAAMPVPVNDAGYAAIPNVGLVVFGGFTIGSALSSAVQTLTASGSSGVGFWQSGTTGFGEAGFSGSVFPRSTGVWDFFVTFSDAYWTFPVYSVPSLSVPLPATVLTGGARYHVVMQQFGQSLNNNLRLDLAQGNLPNPLRSPVGGPANWATFATSGFSVPIEVYANDGTGPLWHTYEDSGMRLSTLVNRNMIGPTLVGALESVQFADATALADAWTFTYSGNLATTVNPL